MAKPPTALDLAREIEKLVELEVLRIHLLTNTPTADLLARLQTHNTPNADAVCARLATKLISQLTARHTIACDVSERHEGMGYSRQAIEKHVIDALEQELTSLLAPLDVRAATREHTEPRKTCIEFADTMEVVE